MAAPIEIQKNSFYRKHVITSAGAVELLPSLTDSALTSAYGTSKYDVKGGVDANIFLLSGATPPALNYGDGQLVGGDLVLYCSGTELSTSGAPPVVEVYAAVSGTTFTEGGMELSHGWENLTGPSGSIAAGSAIITGANSPAFKTNYQVGDGIKVGDERFVVAEITSDTQITISGAVHSSGIAATSNNLYKPRFYGNELAVYTAHTDNSLFTYSESFDGGQTLGQISVPGYNVSEPYINLNSSNAAKLASTLYAGGNYSLTYGLYQTLTGEDGGPTGSDFFMEYFGSLEDHSRDKGTTTSGSYEVFDFGATGAPEDRQTTNVTYTNTSYNNPFLYLKPLDEDKLDDLWVPLNDFRQGMQNIFAFTPYWRWKDIKNLVQFKNREKVEVEEAEDVNPNNTIFDSGMIYASPNISTFYGGGDSAGLPVNKSIIQISNEAYDDGGSALQLYNLWSYSNLNAYTGDTADNGGIDPMYGVSGAANPQFTCVGMKNVPYPITIDNAFNTQSQDSVGISTTRSAWDNATLPEINIKFNVKEMDVNPTIGSSLSDDTNRGLQKGKFTDYFGADLTAGASVNRYSTATTVIGTTNWSEPADGPFDRQFRTLMRNFTICFSNYPPTEGENLDAFLDRGLTDFYNGTSSGKLIVGGITVFKDRSANGVISSDGSTASPAFTKGNGQTLTAMPLQVTNSAYAAGNASSGYGGTTLSLDATRNRILKFRNGFGNNNQSAEIMCFSGIPSRAQTADGLIGEPNSLFEESVNLSMDEFVNAKIVFNIQGGGYGGKAGGTAAINRGYTDQCRVYFTEGAVNNLTTDTTTPSVTTFANEPNTTDEILSLPIYFPQQTQNSTGGMGSTFLANPAYWPRYMTLWVTNYRQTNNVSTSTDDLNGEKQPWTDYTSNRADFGLTSDFPDDYGSDKQTNVFVDTIKFSNFTNAVHNASAKSTGMTDNIVIKQWPVKSPVTTPPAYTKMIQDDNRMFGSKLNNYYMPTYVLMGFDNGPDDYFISGTSGGTTTAGATQWYQWHGFGTSAFQNLEHQTPRTTNFNQSWWKGATRSGPTRRYGNWMMNSFYAYMFYTSGANNQVNSSTPDVATATPMNGSYTTNITTGATQPTVASDNVFNIANEANTYLFTDGLTQKGFTQFGTKNTGSYPYVSQWAKREHPYLSAKITAIPELENDAGDIEKGVIKVDSASIFDMPLSDEYIIYMAGSSARTMAQVFSEDSWDYNTKSSTVLNSNAITTDDSELEALQSTITALITADSGSLSNTILSTNYIHTGSYIALVPTGATSTVTEIVKVEEYVIGGGTTASSDRMTVTRGQLGTTPTAAAIDDYYLYPITNVFAAKGVKQRQARDGNNIFLDTEGLDSIVNSSNLPYLYISPYKYWQWIQMWPGGVSGSVDPDDGKYPTTNGGNSSPKAYSGISLMKGAATGSVGTTYSEETYTWLSNMTGSVGRGAPYNSIWNLHSSISGSSIEVNQDYGFGPYTEDTNTGGQVTTRPVYSQNPMAFNLDGYVNNTVLGNSEPVVNKVTLGQPLLSSSTVFYGNDYTTQAASQGLALDRTIIQEDVRPYYLWRYLDTLPTVSNFTVGPAFNLLDRETNLYDLTNENLNAVKFNWSESGEDIWYRMLLVDDKAIYSKYHGYSNAPIPTFYAALNEAPTDVTKSHTDGGFTLVFKESTTDTINGTSFTPTVDTGARMSPEGLQGYAFDTGVSGAASRISWTNTQSKMMFASSNYTMIFHLTPGVYDGATAQTIFERGTLANGGLIITMESGKIKVTMGGITTPLTSNTVSPRDAEQPMMVAVIYDKHGDVPCKLFINGKLEDYSITGTTDPSESVDSYMCNNAGNSQPYYGLIEEVILYNNTIHFPDDTGQHILDGSRYQEFSTDVQSLHAKLFVMDYHNIRGDGKDEVCSTPTISWRSTIA